MVEEWTTDWVSVEFSRDGRVEIAFLRWYVPFEGGLAMMLSEDDPLLRYVGVLTASAAAVSRRGAKHTLRQYQAVELVKAPHSVEAVRAAMRSKYGWRWTADRALQSCVRRLGSGRRVDVAVRIEPVD